MKQATITKAVDSALPADQLALINRYCRRALEPEEIYTFSLILCDNEVDRDFERFTRPALERLAKLFEGTTGIFDHNPKGQNQTSRIYKTEVRTQPDRLTAAGEVYTYLKAWAYMVRCEKNNDLILEIDGGIKKEVSVGCQMASITCSVCGGDSREGNCRHIPGKHYKVDGKDTLCHRLLDQPTDAYEWSFVAVPAQPAAGVTKGGQRYGGSTDPVALRKELGGGSLTLSPAQGQALGKYIDTLEDEAALGKEYLCDLRRRVLRLGLLTQPEVESTVLEKALSFLSCDDLCSLERSYTARADREMPPVPQLYSSATADAPAGNTQFKI